MIVVALLIATIATTVIYQRTLAARVESVGRRARQLLEPDDGVLEEIETTRDHLFELQHMPYALHRSGGPVGPDPATLVQQIEERRPGWLHALDALAIAEPQCGAAPIHAQVAYGDVIPPALAPA